jgi:rhamnosyltransferase
MLITVVIRARNVQSDLQRCLPVIRDQRLPYGVRVQIVVVDNESSDGSVEVAKLYGAIVVPIRVEEFTWGRAINRGIGAVPSDVTVLLSADATPANEEWLSRLIEPFKDANIAAVYGRQLPRPDAPVDEVVRLRRAFDESPRDLNRGQVEADLAGGRWVCSNACAAIRTCVWSEIAFDEQVPASEEVPWIRSVLGRGFSARYEPTAQVYHSHHESVLRYAIRIWEFYENTCRQQGRPRGGSFRVVASMSRGRIRNCMSRDAGAMSATRGLLRLPLECAMILWLAAIVRWDRANLERLRRRSREANG